MLSLKGELIMPSTKSYSLIYFNLLILYIKKLSAFVNVMKGFCFVIKYIPGANITEPYADSNVGTFFALPH